MTRHHDIMCKQLEEGLSRDHPPFHVVPGHMHGAIRNYVINHLNPGDFLTAVLSNDLREAFGRADERNLVALHDWVNLLYNYVPGQCWGSQDAVYDWTTCVLCSGEGCPACKDTGAAAQCENPSETWWKGKPDAV